MRGLLSHVDFSVGSPRESIRFYQALLGSLGFTRRRAQSAEWQEPSPTRAAWAIRYPDGTSFGIDLRPAESNIDRKYDRYEPGPHHIALQADSDEAVDIVHSRMCEIGAEIQDEPTNYGGRPGYGEHYYALFLLDPDGFKVEVVHAVGLEA